CRSLVAPLVLVYLDDELLAFLDGVLDAGSADVHARLEVGACAFLEREQAAAFGAVIDERRLQARLDAGNDPFIDIALALFLARGLDVKIDQLLTVYYRDAQLFRLRRVKQHAFHCYFLPRSDTGWRQTCPPALHGTERLIQSRGISCRIGISGCRVVRQRNPHMSGFSTFFTVIVSA